MYEKYNRRTSTYDFTENVKFTDILPDNQDRYVPSRSVR